MKKFLAVLILMVLVAAAAVVPDKIKRASSVYEQRMFTAVEVLGRSLRSLATGDNLKVAVYSPTAEFDDDENLWSVSGIVGVAVNAGGRDGSGPSGNELFEPFTAQLRNNCKGKPSAACIRVETLTVGGARVLDIGQAAAAIPGLSSMPVEARNRAPSLIEMQAAARPGAMSSVSRALDRPTSLPARPADAARTASVDAARMPAPPTAVSGGPALARSRPVADERPDQETKASSGPKESPAARTAPGAGEIAARPPSPSNSKGAAVPADDAVSSAAIVRIKRGLKRLGYDPGPINDKVGPEAFSAIMAYQRRYEFSLDGKPSLALLKHIEGNKSDSIY